MKKIWDSVKRFKWGYLLFAILFFGAGLCFLCFPETALKSVRIGIGIAAIVFAGIYIALTIANAERGFRFWAKMVLGGLAIVCGGFMIFSSQNAFEYLTFVAGLYLIIDGSFKLQTAILSKRYRSALWWIMLILAAASISLGTVLLRVQFDFSEELAKVSKILGVGLFLDGLQNLLSIGYLYYIEHRTKQTIMDDLRAEGSLVTVLDTAPADTADAPAPQGGGKLTRAEKKAQKKKEKEALAAKADTVDLVSAAETPVPTPAPVYGDGAPADATSPSASEAKPADAAPCPLKSLDELHLSFSSSSSADKSKFD